jgi:hypothetical protein
VGATTVHPAVHAHHDASFFYDSAQSVTLTGTVTEFRFTQPHVLIFVAVSAIDGTTAIWSAGLPSPDQLTRTGDWSETTFRSGDRVTLTGNPAVNGALSIRVNAVFDAAGNSRWRSDLGPNAL